MDSCIEFEIKEIPNNHISVTYDSLLEKLELLKYTKNKLLNYDIIEIENEYNKNTINELQHIYNYYFTNSNINNEIKNIKEYIIQKIIEFEINPDNLETICQRKKIWKELENIKNDHYLSKYLIL